MPEISQYQQPLIDQARGSMLQFDTYDPFESPPSILKAERHYAAMSIGIPLIESNLQNIQICPCCENPINKKPLSICCNEDELLFLGVGYPLYYKLARHVALIVLFVFFISGSGLYYLLTVDCYQPQKCINSFGFNLPNISSQNTSSKAVQIMNMLTAIGIFAFALYIKSLINNDITQLESKVICPSQYTIMLQNLGRNLDESELKKWVRDHLGEEPVSINCAYNIEHLQKAYQRRNEMTIELRRIQIKRKKNSNHSSSTKLPSTKSIPPSNYIETHFDLNRERQLYQEIQRYDKLINEFKNNEIDCDKNGTAFVTFEYAQTAVDILEKHQHSQLPTFILNILSIVIRKDPMQFNNRTVKISRAPAPREIIWHNLSYSYLKSLLFQFMFVCSMMLLIYFAFEYQFKFSTYAYRLRQESKQTGQKFIMFQAVIASLIVILLNAVLRIIIFIFSKLKRYHSHTSQQSAFCFYYTLMYVFNSCFMIYIVHGQYPEESNQLLLVDIHIIMLANAFSEPLFKLCDPTLWYTILWRRYVTSLPPQRNPYTQMYLNKLYEGHQILNGDNYQYLARMLIIPIWFAYAAPVGVLISLIGMVMDYWIGKMMLIKFYKKPQNISKDIALVVVNIFQLLPLIYICGLLQYTYKATTSQSSHHNASIVEFLLHFFNYSITGSVLVICITGYLLFIKTKTIVVQNSSYQKIKNYFGFNYETQNPVTRYRGDVNYLQALMNSPQVKGQNLSMGELKMSMGDDIQSRRLNVAKIKVKMECINKEIDESDEQIQMRELSLEKDRLEEDRIRQSSSLSNQSSQKDKSRKPKRNKSFFLKRTKSIFV